MNRLPPSDKMKTRFLLFILSIFAVASYSQNPNPANDSLLTSMLHPDGAGWGFYKDKAEAGNKKKVLLIGDSMLSGYGELVKSGLKEMAVVDFWKTGLHEAHPDLSPCWTKCLPAGSMT